VAVAEDQDGERAAGRVPLLDLEHEERLVETLADLQKIETAGFHRMLEVSKWVNIGCGPRAVSKRGCTVGSAMPLMHVLVLERDPERRDALLRALRAEGHHAVAAPDAAAAAAALGLPGFDALLLDLGLPDLDITRLREAVAPAQPAAPEPLEAAERRHIALVLRYTDGNKRQAAHLLGISRSTLLHKVRKYGLTTRPDTAGSS
jgi:CheY-like chemotaxis protein